MRRLALLLAGLAALLLGLAHPAAAAPCGLPDARPWWIDFADGSVPFRTELFARPGVIVATPGTTGPAILRGRGALTVHWEMNLWSYVGTPAAPADPTTIPAAAGRLSGAAVLSTGCPTPVIALNELLGPGTPAPWSPTVAQYRSNVLGLVQALAGAGARPALLVPLRVDTAGDAAAWWQAVGQVADIVPEAYVSATAIAAQPTPLLQARALRVAFRAAAAPLLALGIERSRVGIMLGLHSGPSGTGRRGLNPPLAWMQIVKLEALAARQVAADDSLGSIWSWGWGTFGPTSADPDKPAAACTYLWARDPSLCDAATLLGPQFDASRDEASIALGAGLHCQLDQGGVYAAAVERLTAAAGGRPQALSALLQRAVMGRVARVRTADVLRAERGVIARDFAGRRSAYRAALDQAKLTLEVARGILADELRRRGVEATLPAPAPTAATVRSWALAHGGLRAVSVEVQPAATWLGGRTRGTAVSTLAPRALFSTLPGSTLTVRSTSGAYRVRVLSSPRPLVRVAARDLQPAVGAALAAGTRAAAFPAWLASTERTTLDAATCLRDELPASGEVDLARTAPFLRLDAF